NFRTEKDLIDYITKIGELRNQLPSLTRGTMEMIYEKNGMAVYKRVYKEETAIIVVNNTRKSQHVTLTNSQVEGGKELRGLLEGNTVRSKNDKYDIILDRDLAEIFVLTKKSGINFTLIGSIVAVYILVFLFLWKIKKRKE
ncbi:MAG: alpha-glucosidase C-terminal domain-containing protein, partial [Neobacillus sp.]